MGVSWEKTKEWKETKKTMEEAASRAVEEIFKIAEILGVESISISIIDSNYWVLARKEVGVPPGQNTSLEKAWLTLKEAKNPWMKLPPIPPGTVLIRDIDGKVRGSIGVSNTGSEKRDAYFAKTVYRYFRRYFISAF